MSDRRLAVVDVQAFRAVHSRDFIFKELSLVDVHTLRTETYLFKPPKDCGGRNEEDLYLQSRHHGISWSSGLQEYAYLGHVLAKIRSRFRFVFAKGYEKCAQLQNSMQYPVYDLYSFGCPGLKSLTAVGDGPLDCPHHSGPKKICAQRQALLLANWCSRNMDRIDLTDYRVRLDTFRNWFSYYNPGILASYGFIHVFGTKLGIRCIYCGFEVDDLKNGFNLQKYHEQHQPECQSFTNRNSE